MIRRRPAKGATRLGLALSLWLFGLGCLISPPIEQRPPELDVRPEYDPEDVTPPNERTVALDQNDPESEDFGLLEVRDRNEDDVIAFSYQLDVDGELVPPPPGATGTLRVDRAASDERGVTVYEPVVLSIDPCSAELEFAGSLTITLTLSDEIPLEQVDPVDRRFAHVENVVWSVLLPGDCPLEN